MKVFIAVLCLVALSSAAWIPKTEDDLNTARRTCVQRFEVTPERVAEFRKRIFVDADAPYVRCVFEVLGLWRDGGFVTDDYLVQLGRGDGVRGDVEGCYDKTGTNEDLWAFRTFQCLLKGGLLPKGY